MMSSSQKVVRSDFEISKLKNPFHFGQKPYIAVKNRQNNIQNNTIQKYNFFKHILNAYRISKLHNVPVILKISDLKSD